MSIIRYRKSNRINNGLRVLLLLIFVTGVTSSCNRSLVKSQAGTLAYKDDTLTSPNGRDLDKVALNKISASLVQNTKSEPNLNSLAYNHKIERIDSLVDDCFRRQGFHGTVLVGEKGKIVYEKAVGLADFSSGELLKTNSIFQLASVSKQFTAMCIMILKQQGKLNYDDELSKYFPELPYPGITIRHLLNHTSGLPNYMWLVTDKWRKDYPPYNNEIIELMAKYHPAKSFKPGLKFQYSNTGYMLLAAIVEKVSGLEFMDFADANIFTPLGMTNTFIFCSSRVCAYKNHVCGYKPSRRGLYRVGEDVLDGSVGDKGVHSTVEDLYKWDQALYGEKLVRQETLADAFTRGRLSNNREVDYGFGFRIVDRGGKHIIYHNGLWNGFRSALIRDVANNITIIVLNHTNSAAKHTVANGIQKIMYDIESPLLMGADQNDESLGGGE